MNETEEQVSVPLTRDEMDHLRSIYNKRLKIFCAGYAFFVGFLVEILLPFTRLDEEHLYKRIESGTDYMILDYPINREDLFYVYLLFFGGIFFTLGCVTYFRSLHPFLKDVRSGMKDPVVYTVVNKLSFEHTNEYFLSFDDPNYMHYEVESEVYYQCAIGDQFVLYRARFSKHVFEKDFRFTLL